MQLLSIFNNGSQLWILFLLWLVWLAIWGYRTIRSHKSGYHKQLPSGQWVDVPGGWKAFLTNPNFIFLVAGTVGIWVFIFIINSDYK